MTNISPDRITKYYLVISILYVLGLFLLPHDYWNYTPLMYILLGPVVLGFLQNRLNSELSAYVNENHPELLKRYAVHFGLKKGKVLDPMNVFQNKKTFLEQEDPELNKLVELTTRCQKFTFISFLTILLVIPRIIMMWS